MRGKAVFGCILVFLLFGFAPGAFALTTALEQEIQQDFQETRFLLQAVLTKLRSGARVSTELDRLKALSASVKINHLLLQERFKDRKATLEESALERHLAMEARYVRAIAAFTSLVDHLPPAEDLQPEDLQPIRNLLEDLLPPRPRPLLGALPYRHLNFSAKEPVFGPAIVPAYNKGEDGSATADTPGAAETLITTEIAALAESLGWNPVRIYEWVQASIETEWYWGSMKGAAETLRQRSGNDADQSALLIALLRASGFPARYVRGVIEFFPGIEQIRKLTGLEDPMQVATFFQKTGIPFQPIVAGGKIANFRIEHIWVETLVPYANYRGARLDDFGKTWVALDAHMKPAGYRWNDPKDFGADFNLAALRDDYLAETRSETPLEHLRSAFEQHQQSHFAATTYQDHLRTRTLASEPLGILPAGLQFHQAVVTGEYTELPAAHFLRPSSPGNTPSCPPSCAIR